MSRVRLYTAKCGATKMRAVLLCLTPVEGSNDVHESLFRIQRCRLAGRGPHYEVPSAMSNSSVPCHGVAEGRSSCRISAVRHLLLSVMPGLLDRAAEREDLRSR